MPARIGLCHHDPAVSARMTLELTRAGYDVQEPCSGVEEILGWLAVEPPEVMLLDLDDPACGGLDLLGWLRLEGLTRRVRVGVLAADPASPEVERARQMGARGRIAPPAQGEALLAAVRRLLDPRLPAWTADLAAASPEPAFPPAAGGRDGLVQLNPVVAGLVTAYGASNVARLLEGFVAQLALIAGAATDGADLEAAAHAAKGAAASLGFEAVARACGEVEAVSRAGGDAGPALTRAADVAARTRAEIQAGLAAAA